jgi:uroporphyrinogen decarboxylase
MPSEFLKACRSEQVDHVPVWFMRQAGRSLPEYRSLREKFGILELCRTPELTAEVTLQPIRRLGVDAAILFSDIVVPLQAIGIELEIRPQVGPVVESPFGDASDVDRLRPLEPEIDVPFVIEAVKMLVAELGSIPLIGFAGAPFTLASYLIEGGPSQSHLKTKTLMYSQPELWQKLMDRLADIVLAFLKAQVEAGANAVQLFDSWVGHIGATDYRNHVMPSVQRIFSGLEASGVPRIHFGIMTSHLLELMKGAGADVMGIDWRTPIDEARTRLGPRVPLQGNLDPTVCLGPWDVIEERALDILRRGQGIGHIFNLGHGVLPGTDPDKLKRLVDLVHSWDIPRGA